MNCVVLMGINRRLKSETLKNKKGYFSELGLGLGRDSCVFLFSYNSFYPMFLLHL